MFFSLQVGVSLSDKQLLNELKPVTLYKHCTPPCNGKTPCIRICKSCTGVSQYPNLSRNLRVYDNRNSSCSVVSKDALDSLFGKGMHLNLYLIHCIIQLIF